MAFHPSFSPCLCPGAPLTQVATLSFSDVEVGKRNQLAQQGIMEMDVPGSYGSSKKDFF